MDEIQTIEEVKKTTAQKIEWRKRRTTKYTEYLHNLFGEFSLFEKTLAFASIAALFFSVGLMLKALNVEITTEVPVRGGSFTEGFVGSPRFINPVLAVSDTDRALTSLVYSGLVRVGVDGTIIPDLAQEYTISDDGKTYTFKLRNGLTFHDRTTLTASDVAFTIAMARDPMIKSSHRAEWEGIVVETPDEHTIVMRLEKPYAPFIYNTVIGILPKHIWANLTHEEIPFSTLNINAVGSGPYLITQVAYASDGIPKSISLKGFSGFSLGEPYVHTIETIFYANSNILIEKASTSSIDAYGGISAEEYTTLPEETKRARPFTLPRVFAVFYNQFKNPALAENTVRTALTNAIDKNKIVQEVLLGYAVPIDGPLPVHTTPNINAGDFAKLREGAIATLAKAGWEKDANSGILMKDKKELSITLATANTEELKTAARVVADAWRSLGVRVKVEFYDAGDLNQVVVRPRSFDALLFGQVIGRDGDVFAFWHSSQRTDPGLNITQYTSKEVDTVLEKARTVVDADNRIALFEKMRKILKSDVPAAFLYVPQYMYTPPAHVRHVILPENGESYERFSQVYTWYIDSTRVWNFFIK